MIQHYISDIPCCVYCRDTDTLGMIFIFQRNQISSLLILLCLNRRSVELNQNLSHHKIVRYINPGRFAVLWVGGIALQIKGNYRRLGLINTESYLRLLRLVPIFIDVPCRVLGADGNNISALLLKLI